MNREIELLKGIAPGLVLERELRKRQLAKNKFAEAIDEYPQVLGDIMKGKRRINPRIAIKLDHELGKEDGYFMVLQAFYDMAQERRRMTDEEEQELPKLRPVLFWDTDIEKLDWQKQKTAIIRRVFERGNVSEKKAITRFYGQVLIDKVLSKDMTNTYRLHR